MKQNEIKSGNRETQENTSEFNNNVFKQTKMLYTAILQSKMLVHNEYDPAHLIHFSYTYMDLEEVPPPRYQRVF